MQESKVETLKDIASKLGINYSSAKTIIQTFRKEKRFIKKEKKQINTLYSLKKVKLLQKSFDAEKTNTVFSKIMDDFNFGNFSLQKESKSISFPFETNPSTNNCKISSNSTENRSYISSISSVESIHNLIPIQIYTLNSVSIGINTEIDINEDKYSKDVFFVHDSEETFQENFNSNEIFLNSLNFRKKRNLLPGLPKDFLSQLMKEDSEVKKNQEFEFQVNFHLSRIKIWNSFLESKLSPNIDNNIIDRFLK